jgi:hypothetical protein
MQYTCLIYLDEKKFYALSKDEQNQIHKECGEWHDDLVRVGKSPHGSALQPGSTAHTFRMQDGKVIMTDGPFAETKEVLGGFDTLECESLDEALQIAARFPGLKAGGAMEVRPHIVGNCEAV